MEGSRTFVETYKHRRVIHGRVVETDQPICHVFCTNQPRNKDPTLVMPQLTVDLGSTSPSALGEPEEK